MNNIEESPMVSDVFNDARSLAKKKRNYQIDIPHLWCVMIQEGQYAYDFYNSLNIDLDAFTELINDEVDKISVLKRTDQKYGQVLSQRLKRLKDSAEVEAKNYNDEFVTINHFILALYKQGNNPFTKFLKNESISSNQLKKQMNISSDKPTSQKVNQNFQFLETYATNLNEKYKEGRLSTVIGRENEVNDIVRILTRKGKNNAILIGHPGVGKTAVVERLAAKIVEGDIPHQFKDKILFNLDLSALIAGAQYRGDFEDRLKSVLNEIKGSSNQIILFIDEIHTIVGAGQTSGSLDAGNILKPMLSRGELNCIGATTQDEYRENIEKDKALERRFQRVQITEPSPEETVKILGGIKHKYEMFHQTVITDQAIEAAVSLSNRYITDRFLPDKAIDVMDEASAARHIRMNQIPDTIKTINNRILNLKMEMYETDNNERQQALESQIETLEIEQHEQYQILEEEHDNQSRLQSMTKSLSEMKHDYEEARTLQDIETISVLKNVTIPGLKTDIKKLKNDIYKTHSNTTNIIGEDDIAGVIERLTGVKVRGVMEDERKRLLNLDRTLKKRVVGQDTAIDKVTNTVIRMRSGVQNPNRPSGSFIFLGPSGVGKTELAKSLAEALFGSELEMVRLDMSEYMEKHAVSRLVGPPPGYVGYDEGGQLTEAVHQRLYSIVLLDEIEKAHEDVFDILLQVLDEGHLTDSKGRKIDFKNTILIMTSNIGSRRMFEGLERDGEINANTEKTVIDELRGHFKPEFLNRIDDILLFNPLQQDHMYEIAEIMLSQLKIRLAKQGVTLNISKDVIQWLAVHGYDRNYGARPLQRFIIRKVETPIARAIISRDIQDETDVSAELWDDDIEFSFKKMNNP